jgi:hypothetical protein
MSEQEVRERFDGIAEAQWVREMREHFSRTGTYRPQDLRRALGDPAERVEMSPEASLSKYFHNR